MMLFREVGGAVNEQMARLERSENRGRIPAREIPDCAALHPGYACRHQEVAMRATGIRMKNPAHPGGFVKTEIIEALGLSVTAAAGVLGVTRPALSALLNARANLSLEMALRIEKAFGVAMDTLMRMQNSYDIAAARKREADIKVAPFKGKPRDPLPSPT